MKRIQNSDVFDPFFFNKMIIVLCLRLPPVICLHWWNLWLILILLIYNMLFFNTFKDIKFLNQVHKNADFWQNLKMADIFWTQSEYLWHCYQQTYELVFCITVNHQFFACIDFSHFDAQNISQHQFFALCQFFFIL